MNRDDNVIAFPAVAPVGRTQHRAVASREVPAVIDFASCRHAANARAQARAMERSARELTAGEVWDALDEDRLVMQYQPQYDMVSGKTVAVEALARLVDTDGQLIYPDRFIGLVEQSDLVVPLGRAVIAGVCADLAAARAEGCPIRRVAVNLSARQLNIDSTLLDFIDQTVAFYGLDHADLEFELTERQSLTPECEGLSVLDEIAQRGTRIVIDDFGIGYSSIVYLAELPVSAFKLDRALVSRLPEDGAMQMLVESLLALAARLDLDVIAEGIESKAQHDYLLLVGCPYAQGFAYAKPMNMGELLLFLADDDVRSGQNILRT